MPRAEYKERDEIKRKLANPDLSPAKRASLEKRLERVTDEISQLRKDARAKKHPAPAPDSPQAGRSGEPDKGILAKVNPTVAWWFGEKVNKHRLYNGTLEEFLTAWVANPFSDAARMDSYLESEGRIPFNDDYWTSPDNPRNHPEYWVGKDKTGRTIKPTSV
jgi:hypothetical protein